MKYTAIFSTILSNVLLSNVAVLRAAASLGAAAALWLCLADPVPAAAGRDPASPLPPSGPDAGERTGGEDGAQPGDRPRGLQTAALAAPRAAVSGTCLPDELKRVVASIEQRWGRVEIISTHRPGARVAGSGRPSRHARCRAVDFRPAKGTYREVANWLKKTHDGGVGTYSSGHIHVDDGPNYRWHN